MDGLVAALAMTSFMVLLFALWCFRLLQEKSKLQADFKALQSVFSRDKAHWREKITLLEKAREELSQSFSALSAQALERNNQAFLNLAVSTLEKYQTVA